MQNLLTNVRGKESIRRVSAHSTSVRASVAIVGRLVVLRENGRKDGLSIREDNKGSFGSLQEFLQHDLFTSSAKFSFNHYPSYGIAGFFSGARHDDPLASRKSIRFDDDGVTCFAGIQDSQGFTGVPVN